MATRNGKAADKDARAEYEANRAALLAMDLPTTGTAVIRLAGTSHDLVVPVRLRDFSSGSRGYHGADKVVLQGDAGPVRIQANVVLTVIGTRPWGDDQQ